MLSDGSCGVSPHDRRLSAVWASRERGVGGELVSLSSLPCRVGAITLPLPCYRYHHSPLADRFLARCSRCASYKLGPSAADRYYASFTGFIQAKGQVYRSTLPERCISIPFLLPPGLNRPQLTWPTRPDRNAHPSTSDVSLHSLARAQQIHIICPYVISLGLWSGDLKWCISLKGGTTWASHYADFNAFDFFACDF